MKKSIGIGVLVVFIGVLILHAVVGANVEIGLDQKLSMPKDSYVLKYFQVRQKFNTIKKINFIGLKSFFFFYFSIWKICCQWDRQCIL